MLDIGVGSGEPMPRPLEALPDATGTGVDLSEEELARGRASAVRRGLADRVTFVCESRTGSSRGPADVVLCDGASQAVTGAEPPAHIVDRAVAAGFRPERTEVASLDERDAFKSGYRAGVEEWLAAHPDAAGVRQRADEHRDRWLRGHRGLLGFACLTLIPAA